MELFFTRILRSCRISFAGIVEEREDYIGARAKGAEERTAGTSWLGDEKCHKVRPPIEEAATESLFQLALGNVWRF